MRVLQREVDGLEFALWGVYFERRAENRRKARGEAQQRDPRAVYQEFRAALLTYTGVNHGG